MNKVQQFAANLKKRKGTGKRTPRSHVPGPASQTAGAGLRGTSTLVRLKAELRSAKERAEKAEKALAAVAKVNAEVWRLNQTIARLRGFRNRPGALDAAMRRITELEAEIEELHGQREGK